ncbi:hypothetical protein D9M69_614450 [compost metagenome]
MHPGAGAPGHFRGRQALEGRHAQACAGIQRAVPSVDVFGAGGRPEPSLLAEVRVDAVALAEFAQFIDGPLCAVAEKPGLFRAAE